MNVVKAATEWTRAEMLSSAVFVAFGAAFLLASLGFGQMGRTEVARAFVVPLLVAGGLLVVLGSGLFAQNWAKLGGLAASSAADGPAFVAAEIARAEKVMGDYRLMVFRVFPAVIALCAMLFVLLDGPLWRASLIAAIAMLTVILIVDTNANARLEVYRDRLIVGQTTR